jgi:Double-GTPase 2/Sporulation and spore germination
MAPVARSRLRTALGLLGLTGLAVLAAPPAGAQASGPVPILTGVSAAHYQGYDQLTFTFAGALPSRHSARYVSALPGTGQGPAVTAVGNALLLVTFSPASGTNSAGHLTYGPAQRTYSLPGVIQVVTVEDTQGVLRLGVGLARNEPVHVAVLPHSDQVVVDVHTPRRTAVIKDYFVNSRVVFGTSVARVDRLVSPSATPTRALQRLFAGPTQAEQARGLEFVSSGATGFTRLDIQEGVASVYLAGSCQGGGSATTVASEIVPTLRQFPSVQWVKIYDPSGNTQEPDGDTDSIPVCLKPSAMNVWTAGHGGLVLLVLLILAGIGVLLGVVLSVASLVAGLSRRQNLITPSEYHAERVKAHPVATGQFGPDMAWPFYPLRQVRADLARVEAERRARYGKLWKWPFSLFIWVLFAPVSVAALLCLLVAGLTTLLLAALFALVMWACAGVTAAVFGVGVLLLRAAEGAWHARMRTEASCPHCYHVTRRPAYRCPGCLRLHRDVRPGRLGLFARRCTCGTLLPTMVLRAAWHLEAVCQKCGKPLRAGSAALRDVRIPIFGDTSAGKTRFLYAGLDSLIDTTARAGVAFGFPDEESQDQATVALGLIRSGQDTVKTSQTLPTAVTCRLGSGAGSTLVHLFDTAGENYRDAQLHDSLGFLDRGQGLVYVLDPFSVGSISDRMAGQNSPVIEMAHAAAGDPENAYNEVVSRLRDSGVKAAEQRLAIVVSKADLLVAGGIEPPKDSAAIADWLAAMGVHNLILSARREFAEVRYFTVASLAGAEERRGHDPGAPLRWLLASFGVRLPAEPGQAGAAGPMQGPHRLGRPHRVGAARDETTKARP